MLINMKKIAQYTVDKIHLINIFPSIALAEKKTNINTIRNCLYKKQKTAGGFHWEYYDKEKAKYRLQKTNRLPVTQMDKNGAVINTFESLSDASRFTGIDKSNIWRCIKGLRPTAGDYCWQ